MNDTKINIHAVLAERQQIALIWSIEDVLEVRPDLSDDQAWEVLKIVDRRHDATCGVTWDTLAYIAAELFGSQRDTGNNTPEIE